MWVIEGWSAQIPNDTHPQYTIHPFVPITTIKHLLLASGVVETLVVIQKKG